MTTAHIHLDFVGHAAATDRLLQVDPSWSWVPFAIAADGGPLVRVEKNRLVLWIRLTICGVTRPGVGIVEPFKGEPEKELISDALRNGAMRFGVALDLWSKQDLHDSAQDATQPEPQRPARRALEGWADIETQRMAEEVYKQRALDELDAPKREELKAYCNELGLGWPMTAEAMGVAMAKLDDLAAQLTLDVMAAADAEGGAY